MSRVPLWQRLRPIRLSVGLTLTEMGERLELSHAYLSQMERGERGIRLDTVELYVAACGHHLEAIPDAYVDDLARQVPDSAADRRLLLIELAAVLPHVPDLLVDDLKERVAAWKARFPTD